MDWKNGKRLPPRDGYGQGLLELCAQREDIVVLDADVAASTRTNWVRISSRSIFIIWASVSRTWSALPPGWHWGA